MSFETLFKKFHPEIKQDDMGWDDSRIIKKDNGIFLVEDYATYFKDIEQTFYFDIYRGRDNYNGEIKMWTRGKEHKII